jgi:glucose-6-phosphate dehydrogenase assembly protein OpcA
MSNELVDTNASQVASALLRARREAGSPAMGMVLTLIVVTDEGSVYDSLRAATAVTKEHPARILGAIRKSSRGEPRLDAEVKIGGGSGEAVLLRMSGALTQHPESVVSPLLLADSPVVTWWPTKAPDVVAEDALGSLAQRRITDSAFALRAKSKALLTQALHYSPGNTDLAWTRLTHWRALLATALDQYTGKVRSAEVTSQRISPSADLLAAWLRSRLNIEVSRSVSSGPGITLVRMATADGDIAISRPDGKLAQFSIPGQPDRPVALKRREPAELLAEELRRLDPDDVYAQTLKVFAATSQDA